ncbi:flavodoxin [Cellvibrio sp. BR]|jgi:MioC protein|uniref:flavodoxin domain-containing protein n=1 Tax=unclassified Cellvibrio TaxID=2624793 RepID=UPI0002600F3A|nr:MULTISPECIES: flavodoxin domain-containing protein [unclassified Cellvibrio]EIK44649.1 flavodoxin [Cellvibrio sp. BR]QEY12677.1 flavodoxin [Cellvibrio sp. KY-YJ-3]
MSKIQIFIGSVYGGAEEVAELVGEELRSLGHEVTLNTYARAEDLARDANEIILLCHSNTGSGELPDNIQPLYLHLTRDYPRISGRRFGVINLGDSSYTTFNEAGVMLAAAFEDLGAQPIGEPLVLDASSGDDAATEARTWVKHWATLI